MPVQLPGQFLLRHQRLTPKKSEHPGLDGQSKVAIDFRLSHTINYSLIMLDLSV